MTEHDPPRDNSIFQTQYREVTWSAIIFGVIAGVIMNAAITYAGLKIGFTIGGSAIAAVLGFGILRGLLRRGTILETNVAQTIASAVNTSNSGIIFTVPVLFLLGYDITINSPDFWLITLAGVAGALLGTAFIIPLRKQMIDIERLRFPTGTAVAAILKAPGAGAAKSLVLIAGIVIGMAIFLPTQETALGQFLPESVNVGKWLKLPPQFDLVFAVAPFALGAGYLTGRAGLYVLAGGILAFFFLTPAAFSLGLMPESITAEAAPGFGFRSFNRPLGIGLLLGGALMGVLFSLPSIKEALKSVLASKATGGGADELGGRTLGTAVIGAFLVLFLAADFVGNQPLNPNCPIAADESVDRSVSTVEIDGYTIGFSSEEAAETWAGQTIDKHREFLSTLNAKPGWLAGLNRHLRAAIIALVGSLWIWLAGIIIAQCTGMTDWSPISGMALLTIVLVLALAGSGAVIFGVLIGAALCVAITLAADMMQDMKTGYLVGAQPRRQQIAELSLVGIGPVISMLTLIVISQGNVKDAQVKIDKAHVTIAAADSSKQEISDAKQDLETQPDVIAQGGFGAGSTTTAPQAQALEAVITGVQGGDMPYALYAIGAFVGCLLGVAAFPGLGVLVGLSMYLPFEYIATYGIGCVINMIVTRVKGTDWAESWGVPFSAGLIVGESILALIFAIITVFF